MRQQATLEIYNVLILFEGTRRELLILLEAQAKRFWWFLVYVAYRHCDIAVTAAAAAEISSSGSSAQYQLGASGTAGIRAYVPAGGRRAKTFSAPALTTSSCLPNMQILTPQLHHLVSVSCGHEV